MSPQGLLDLARARPFRPFRLILTDGEGYDIRHPELLWVGTREIHIGIAADPDSTLFQRHIVADLLHVVRAEPIGQPQQPGNGQS